MSSHLDKLVGADGKTKFTAFASFCIGKNTTFCHALFSVPVRVNRATNRLTGLRQWGADGFRSMRRGLEDRRQDRKAVRCG
jgi:hypothetical protein